jgi:hypothetical protein
MIEIGLRPDISNKSVIKMLTYILDCNIPSWFLFWLCHWFQLLWHILSNLCCDICGWTAIVGSINSTSYVYFHFISPG